MSLHKYETHKITVETDRGDNNNIHNGNSVRGTIIIVNKVLQYFVSESHSISEVGRKFDVSTSLNPTLIHLLSLYPLCCVK